MIMDFHTISKILLGLEVLAVLEHVEEVVVQEVVVAHIHPRV